METCQLPIGQLNRKGFYIFLSPVIKQTGFFYWSLAQRQSTRLLIGWFLVRIQDDQLGRSVTVAQELPNLLEWVQFLPPLPFKLGGLGKFGYSRQSHKLEIGGSNPSSATKVSQINWLDRYPVTVEATGSSPVEIARALSSIGQDCGFSLRRTGFNSLQCYGVVTDTRYQFRDNWCRNCS